MKPLPYNSNTFLGWLKILQLKNKSPSLKEISPTMINNIVTGIINLKISIENNPNLTFKRKKY